MNFISDYLIPDYQIQIKMETMLMYKINCLEQGSFNVWRRLNMNFIFKPESITAQKSTKISLCTLNVEVAERDFKAVDRVEHFSNASSTNQLFFSSSCN